MTQLVWFWLHFLGKLSVLCLLFIMIVVKLGYLEWILSNYEACINFEGSFFLSKRWLHTILVFFFLAIHKVSITKDFKILKAICYQFPCQNNTLVTNYIFFFFFFYHTCLLCIKGQISNTLLKNLLIYRFQLVALSPNWVSGSPR